MKKILIIANYQKNEGGISLVVSNHFNHLKNDQNIVSIFNTKHNHLFRIFLIIPLIIKVKKFDIIHIHGCSFLGFYPVILGIIVSTMFLKRKTIVTYHGGGADAFIAKYSKWIKKILSRADHITVMSGFLHNIFNNHGIKTEILPNLIDIDVKTKSFPVFNYPKIVSVRALKRNYNIEHIIIAFKIINSRFKDAQLKIIGSGSELDRLKHLCRQENLTEQVEFIGAIPNENIPSEISKSNIMVSVPSYDNQPMSILEAFACGIPVISSNVGGIPFMIKDKINGFLVDVNAPEQIAEKVEWIMCNPLQVMKIITCAQQELYKYRWEEISKELYKLYNC